MSLLASLDMVGRTLAHYRINATIGAGGMGEAYSATDTKLSREIALKILPPDMARDPERLSRFQREARTVAALNHPNIVTIYSVEEAEGVHFLTMELIEGHSLKHCITERGMPVEQIVKIARALSEALAATHEKGIMHRDLKPANVMVTGDSRVKVLVSGSRRSYGWAIQKIETRLVATSGSCRRSKSDRLRLGGFASLQ
jgi:eukaryotic-like serine/threonine-protein kinase